MRFLHILCKKGASAAETLGQDAFPEHFPVDGKPQELKPEKDRPMPTWIWFEKIILKVDFVSKLSHKNFF